MNNVTIMFPYYPIKRNILVWKQSIMENKQIKNENLLPHSLDQVCSEKNCLGKERTQWLKDRNFQLKSDRHCQYQAIIFPF